MQSRFVQSGLGSVNLALLSLYFVPIWGRDAVRALISPYNGLDDRVHAAAAIYFRQLFDLGTNGLILTSHMLAGVKLVIAAGFAAYAIEFLRSWVTGRDSDRETLDVALTLALVGIVIWALPALALGDAELIRLYATQMLMVVGAVIVVTFERHMEQTTDLSRVTTAAYERRDLGLALPVGALSGEPPPPQAAAAVASIPEARWRNALSHS
jgi:hypothetical protein